MQYDDGILTGPPDADGRPRTLTFGQLASQIGGSGGPISGHIDLGRAQGGPTFAGHIVDVDVDPDTGKVQVLRYTGVAGRWHALHPAYVEGQIQGGAPRVSAWPCTEEYFYDEHGLLRNGSLLDYRMPTTLTSR